MADLAAWALITMLIALGVVHRHLLAALWFRTEDPRTVAVFRIGLGALLFLHLVSIAPIYEYLYSGEGLLTGEEAHTRFGKGTWSPLYSWDSAAFTRGYQILQWVACAAFTVGLATRVTGWLTWFLLLSLLVRNSIDVGGDQVFAGFLFLLGLARSGESYSVDAWLRRRRHPDIEAHRPIPAWPRNLMLFQMIPMLCANGLAKSGALWRDGDMFYFLLNHPAMAPFSTWEVSEIFGTNIFRVMTWFIHAFELFFPLAILGLVIEFVRMQPPAPLPPVARWLSWLLCCVIGLDLIVLTQLVWGFDRELGHAFGLLAGAALAVAPLTMALMRRVPASIRRWIFDPRPWATVLFSFGVLLLCVAQVGRWTGVTMCSAILLVEGNRIGRAFAAVFRQPARPTGLPAPSAGGARRAVLVGLLSSFHVLAITAPLLPHDRETAPWRRTIESPLRRWIGLTTYSQFWKMFAKGNRSWSASNVVVELAGDDETVPVSDGVLGPDDDRVLDRRWKIRSRLLESERYRTMHARWVCRQFTLPSGGRDFTVVIWREHERLPSPAQLAEIGAEEADSFVQGSRRRSMLLSYPCSEGSSP